MVGLLLLFFNQDYHDKNLRASVIKFQNLNGNLLENGRCLIQIKSS